MERVKRDDVEFYINKVNVILQGKGKDYYYHLSSRYNYYAIDKCYYYNSGSGDFKTGLTLREAYNIAYCMYESMYDMEYDKNNLILLENYSLKDLYNICGYREFEVLRTAKHEDIEIIMDNDEHKVLRIYNDDKSNYFDYDIKNKVIVG